MVATNADVPAVDVHFVEYPDFDLNTLGARGVGKIGLAGVAAALANGVYRATGGPRAQVADKTRTPAFRTVIISAADVAISSGASAVTALKIGKRPRMDAKNIVTPPLPARQCSSTALFVEF